MIALAPYTLWVDAMPRRGWHQMAIDEALLERAAAGERWLRLYRWHSCLSFGRHEPAARRYDRAQIAALGLDTVRRPTGGRAVWHARELTYAVAAPADATGPLREAYREIHSVLCDAVARLGIAATLAAGERATPVDAGACFARPAGGEVVVGGGKLVGSAQCRERGGMLQHGSLLLEDDQATVAQVTLAGAPPDGSLPLSRVLGRPVGWEEAAWAVAAAASTRWGPPARSLGEAPDLLARAEALGPRYRSADWTWHGAPPVPVPG